MDQAVLDPLLSERDLAIFVGLSLPTLNHTASFSLDWGGEREMMADAYSLSRKPLNITAIIGTGAPRESLNPDFSGRFETQISVEGPIVRPDCFSVT